MNLLLNLFGKKQPLDNSRNITDEDDDFLKVETISRKRMDLLWLDPPRLSQLEQPLFQYKVIAITMGDSSNLREHDITLEDYEWAKQIEKVVDKRIHRARMGIIRSPFNFTRKH